MNNISRFKQGLRNFEGSFSLTFNNFDKSTANDHYRAISQLIEGYVKENGLWNEGNQPNITIIEDLGVN